MKESLALLLVGLLTGMVFAQSGNNQFRSTNGSGQGVPGKSADSVRTTSDGIRITSRADSAPLPDKVHVPVPNQMREKLLRDGQIIWEIGDQAPAVNKVFIGQDTEPKFGHTPVAISAAGRTNDGKSLYFDLTDEQVRNLDHSYFHYDVPQELRDKVRNIVIRTEAKPQTDFRSTAINQQPPTRVTPPARDASLWRLPGTDNTRRTNDRTGLGNTVQTEQDLLEEQRRRKIWEDEQRIAQQQQELKLQQLRIQQQSDYLNAQSRAAAQTQVPVPLQTRPFQPQPLQTQQPLYTAPTRYATNTTIPPQPQPLVIPQPNPYTWPTTTVNPETEQLRRINAESRLENDHLKDRLAFLENRMASSEQEIANRFRSGNENEPSRSEYLAGNRTPDARRPSLNMSDTSSRDKLGNRESNAPLAAGAPGNGGGQLLILLLLLISAALNFYLWFLARSFHTRYNELANELRETFAATA